MTYLPMGSRAWFRTLVIFLTSAVSFYVLVDRVPELFSRDSGRNGAQGENAYFYSTALTPIAPGEVVVVKKSGEEASRAAQMDMPLPHAREVSSLAPPSARFDNEEKNGVLSPFQVPATLAPVVEFWKRIFSTYGRAQVVMHHRDHLDLVYSVLDFDSFEDPVLALSDSEKKHLRYLLINEERALVLRRLRAVEQTTGLPQAERDVLAAPQLLRAQTGIRERFAQAVAIAGQYLPYMEDMFRDAGLPVELSRLPFIESSFDVGATSAVGAAGIWQFMESTGKLYLRVDADVDERRDPLLASYAAVQFLKHTYDVLGSWPLVVNAYNTGYGRMLEAVKILGTQDITRIIHEFNHPDYQFASRNFYPEFLAALEVYHGRDSFFPEVKPRPALRYDTLSFARPVSLPLLAEYGAVPLDALRELNPSLAPRFFDGTKVLTPDLSLKVPYLSGDRLSMLVSQLDRVKGVAFKQGLVNAGEPAAALNLVGLKQQSVHKE